MSLAEIVGTGRTKTGEEWSHGLLDLAVEAGGAALDEAGQVLPSGLVVGNALGGVLGDQRNLATYLASRLGLGAVEAISVSDDEASGGVALRVALSLLVSGQHEAVLVVGAEKMSDALPDEVEAARASGLDVGREAAFGFGPAVSAGLGMQRYVEQFEVDRDLFYHLAATAHHHAAKNPLAFFSWELPFEQYKRSGMVADPLTVCDQAPICDGAAAVVLRKPSAQRSGSSVHILGSASVSDSTGIGGPVLDLSLPTATRSVAQALSQARIALDEVSCFELHDSSSFIAALSIESIGLAERGQALFRAESGELRVGGRYPMWTFGGNKARGHAPGASGIYQVVESALQLRGEAGDNQVTGAKLALVQCLGSFGATAVTHVLGQ
jgi:acetyl-CoA C-acetyltransferase